MADQFNDKVAIVTGSSAGLGEAIALMFASRGAKVTLCGRDQDRLKSVLDKAVKVSGGHQDRLLTVAGDLNDANVRNQIIEQTVNKFGRLDILVANAGIAGDYRPFANETDENYNNVFDTNLKSVFFLIQKAVPHLEKTRGNIVSISSIASLMVIPSIPTYSMSKAALDHLTRCLAVDLGSKGIRVNTVNPGYFPTLILRHLGDPEEVAKEIAQTERGQTPLKDRVGVSEDVAEAVVFLASDAAGFITGELIRVDGGRSYAGKMTTYSPKSKK
ncbi:unnamed protein product [Candidula unifasciata]|uniref:Uncharacterized protein n=1 Tax=Candidula unifasciata TaxID=100452 RepID=A0A8S3ZYM1_9EUPU|nr:unnamed protein product [Candidula unifasciata]